MIDLRLTIVLDGEKFTVEEIRPADFVALERHMRVSVPELGGRLTFDHLCFLCWRGLRRQGVDVGEYEPFLDRIDMVEPAPDPFVQGDAPSPGP